MNPAAAGDDRGSPKPLQIAAVVIGNALEWYDFIIFGIFTAVISRLFFPADSQYASLLLTTATFGVGFFTRPVGGLLVGIYADRKGRKAALLLIIGMMTVSMAMIAFAPTYAAIGAAAPTIIVLARLLQGVATGGEFPSATILLTESAPAHMRGLYGSWQMVGQSLALLTGSLLGGLLTRLLSPAALDTWGWRIPFLVGLVIAPIGWFIRGYLLETSSFLETRGRPGQTIVNTLAAFRKEVFVSIGLCANATIGFYVVLVYMPTLARAQLNLPLDEAFLAQSIGLIGTLFLIPLFGALSDSIGRRPILIGTLAVYLALAYPLFAWLKQNPSFDRLLLVQIILSGLLAAYVGPLSTALAEQFPTSIRSTALAFAYNVPVMVFGGFAQFLVTWLIASTGLAIAPVFYVLFGAMIGLIAALFFVDRSRESDLSAGEGLARNAGAGSAAKREARVWP